jgi:protein-S-isoprenylcysteine O-methyltransferase Ste14
MATHKTRRGRNWARITFLALTIVGLPFSLPQFSEMFARAPVSALIGIVQVLLQVSALYLIFTAPGRHWFRSRNVRQ